jgi:uncharacterized protein YifE (UPF0438 family)
VITQIYPSLLSRSGDYTIPVGDVDLVITQIYPSLLSRSGDYTGTRIIRNGNLHSGEKGITS